MFFHLFILGVVIHKFIKILIDPAATAFLLDHRITALPPIVVVLGGHGGLWGSLKHLRADFDLIFCPFKEVRLSSLLATIHILCRGCFIINQLLSFFRLVLGIERTVKELSNLLGIELIVAREGAVHIESLLLSLQYIAIVTASMPLSVLLSARVGQCSISVLYAASIDKVWHEILAIIIRTFPLIQLEMVLIVLCASTLF